MTDLSSPSAGITSQTPTAGAEKPATAVNGRAVFAIDMSGAGLVVRTALLTEQNQVIEMPAVFPDLQYALAQIDSLRSLVIERFAQAAQIGIQVMAAQAEAAKQPQTGSPQNEQAEVAVPSAD